VRSSWLEVTDTYRAGLSATPISFVGSANTDTPFPASVHRPIGIGRLVIHTLTRQPLSFDVVDTIPVINKYLSRFSTPCPLAGLYAHGHLRKAAFRSDSSSIPSRVRLSTMPDTQIQEKSEFSFRRADNDVSLFQDNFDFGSIGVTRRFASLYKLSLDASSDKLLLDVCDDGGGAEGEQERTPGAPEQDPRANENAHEETIKEVERLGGQYPMDDNSGTKVVHILYVRPFKY
jgi:hypothetical protein